jgi:ParB family chromosome partitioning protein
MTAITAEKVTRDPVPGKKDEKMEKRRALGRGLASLLPGPRVVSPAVGPRPPAAPEVVSPPSRVPAPEIPNAGVGGTPTTNISISAASAAPATQQVSAAESISAQTPTASGTHVVNLAVESIDKNPYQTRYVFDEESLSEMRDSIKENGVVQPIVVRPAEEEGRYILVLGERRLRASKMAGKETIPALVKKVSLQQAAEMTVLENLVREDLNPLEQAEAFRVLSKEFHLTQAQIAERVGVSRESVSNYMRLLKLPRKVMDYMLEDRLSFSDARLLLGLENEALIEQVAEDVVTHHLKWDEIEERVARLNGNLPVLPPKPNGEGENRGARWVDPNVRAAQTEMERTLGMRVRIKDRNGKGKIVIEYATVDDYERLVEMLRGKASS